MTLKYRAMDQAGISGEVFDSNSFDTSAFDINSWDFGEDAPALVIGAYRGLYLGMYAKLYNRA